MNELIYNIEVFTYSFIALEILLMVLCVPALLNVSQAEESFRQNKEAWIQQVRDTRRQVAKAKGSITSMQFSGKITLPKLLRSGPFGIILPILMKVL